MDDFLWNAKRGVIFHYKEIGTIAAEKKGSAQFGSDVPVCLITIPNRLA